MARAVSAIIAIIGAWVGLTIGYHLGLAVAKRREGADIRALRAESERVDDLVRDLVREMEAVRYCPACGENLFVGVDHER